MTRTHMSIHGVEEIKIGESSDSQSGGKSRDVLLKREEGEDLELTSFGEGEIEVKA